MESEAESLQRLLSEVLEKRLDPLVQGLKQQKQLIEELSLQVDELRDKRNPSTPKTRSSIDHKPPRTPKSPSERKSVDITTRPSTAGPALQKKKEAEEAKKKALDEKNRLNEEKAEQKRQQEAHKKEALIKQREEQAKKLEEKKAKEQADKEKKAQELEFKLKKDEEIRHKKEEAKKKELEAKRQADEEKKKKIAEKKNKELEDKKHAEEAKKHSEDSKKPHENTKKQSEDKKKQGKDKKPEESKIARRDSRVGKPPQLPVVKAPELTTEEFKEDKQSTAPANPDPPVIVEVSAEESKANPSNEGLAKEIESELDQLVASYEEGTLKEEPRFELSVGSKSALLLLRDMTPDKFYIDTQPPDSVVWAFRIFHQFRGVTLPESDTEAWEYCRNYLQQSRPNLDEVITRAISEEFFYTNVNLDIIEKIIGDQESSVSPQFYTSFCQLTGMLMFAIKEACDYSGLIKEKAAPWRRYSRLLHKKSQLA
mmetsp:Transcript_19206/g.35114  ORF Transcript_19206/g.35114 Transcript_19206/m.35114 type:complete len:483 (+) Transcript_19206:965-2413(+)